MQNSNQFSLSNEIIFTFTLIFSLNQCWQSRVHTLLLVYFGQIRVIMAQNYWCVIWGWDEQKTNESWTHDLNPDSIACCWGLKRDGLLSGPMVLCTAWPQCLGLGERWRSGPGRCLSQPRGAGRWFPFMDWCLKLTPAADMESLDLY